MRAAAVGRAPVPVGVSVPIPIKAMVLNANAEYLPGEQAILLMQATARVDSPPVQVHYPQRVEYSVELWTPEDAEHVGILVSSNYYDGTPTSGIGGNGGVPHGTAGQWVRVVQLFARSSNVNLDQAMWTGMRLQLTSTYGHPGMKIRKPTITVTRR